MSNVTALKAAIAAALEGVPGVGTIDLAQMDPDGLPRKLRGTRPYWALSLSALSTMPPMPAGLGGGGETRSQFFAYRLRLEGWRGFVAAHEVTAEWDSLVEAVIDRLLLSLPTIARECPGVRDITNVEAEVGLIAVSSDQARRGESSVGYRAHHVSIQADVEFWRVLSP